MVERGYTKGKQSGTRGYFGLALLDVGQVGQVGRNLGESPLSETFSREVPEKPVKPVKPVRPVQGTITSNRQPPDEESPADAARRLADEGNFTGAKLKAALIRDDVVRNALKADIQRKEAAYNARDAQEAA